MARGRRKGSPDTRVEILDAARREFARVGYQRATIRAIAADADVDPSLVMHYFGSKEQLFAECLDVPVSPAVVLRETLAQADGPFGTTLLATMLAIWDDEENTSAFVAVLRSATGEGAVHDMVREFIEASVLEALEAHLAGPDAQLRAGLIASQLVGLLVGRYLLELDALVSATPEQLANAIGPVIDLYARSDRGGRAVDPSGS